MTDTPPERPFAALNPGKTVLIKIAGTLVIGIAATIIAFWVALAFAFGGSEPILFSLARDPVIWVCLLIAAGGAGLILYARKRERLYRQMLR
jgi:ABC-type phosphate transport system permease subunit